MRARSRTIARSIANSHAMLPAGPAPRMKSWRPTALTSISGQEAGCMKSVTYRPAADGGMLQAVLAPSAELGPIAQNLRQHRDNLWLLGGELIRDLHDAPRLRKRPMDQVVLAALDREGGPLISHGTSEDQQRSFDATCRKVPSLPHRPRQSIDSQAVDMWTTLKKRSPHAHSHNKCKCQARSDIDQEAAVRFTSIRHITHIRRAQPTDSPEEAIKEVMDREVIPSMTTCLAHNEAFAIHDLLYRLLGGICGLRSADVSDVTY